MRKYCCAPLALLAVVAFARSIAALVEPRYGRGGDAIILIGLSAVWAAWIGISARYLLVAGGIGLRIFGVVPRALVIWPVSLFLGFVTGALLGALVRLVIR